MATHKKMSKTALKNADSKSMKITKLADQALDPVIQIVKNMTEALKGTVNLSLEVLAGFKNFANVWIVNETSKTMQEIVGEFRDQIYEECLFLTPAQKTVAYNKSKMKALHFHKLEKEKAKYRHYKLCMDTHPDDTGEGDIGVPPRQLRDLFYIINQIPVLMRYEDKGKNLKGDYTTIEGIPDLLGTIKADKTEMNSQKKKQSALEARTLSMSSKLGSALIKFQNAFENFEEMIKDCNKVIVDKTPRNNVSKITNSVSKKMEADILKLNEFLKESLETRSPSDLKGKFKLIVERSDIVDMAQPAIDILKTASIKTTTSKQ